MQIGNRARTIALSLIVLGSAALATAASAQQGDAWPTQAVRIVVSVSAGSQSDILGRAMTDDLARRWGREVIVENRPGLAGTASVAKAAPDGHTLFLTSNGHAMIQSLNRNLAFDPIKDFSFITRLAILPGILVAPPESGPKTLKELIDEARANPGKLNYASAGLHSASFIAAELLNVVGGIKMVHVPYKGIPDAHTSIMRGDAAVFMTFYSAAADLIASGKLRAIGIAASKRTPVLPDVPAVKEVLPAYEYDAWFGYFAPAGVPRPVIDKVSRDIGEVARQESYRGRFAKLGVDISPSTPEEFERLVKSDSERFIKIFGRADDKAPDKK